jgi:hypothetical protein
MPANPVLLHALRTTQADSIRRVLHAAVDALAETQNFLEMDRLVREHLDMRQAMDMLGDPDSAVTETSAAPKPPRRPPSGGAAPTRPRRGPGSR